MNLSISIKPLNFIVQATLFAKKKPFIHALKFIIKHQDLNPTFLVIKL